MLIPCLSTKIILQRVQNVHILHVALSHSRLWSMNAFTVHCSMLCLTLSSAVVLHRCCISSRCAAALQQRSGLRSGLLGGHWFGEMKLGVS